MLDDPHPRVEVLAVAFEDTILGVDLVDARAPAYLIGEGPKVRMPVPGVGLPDAAGFELVRIEAGLAWLSWTASMRGALLDRSGRCSLDALAADGARMLSLERGQTVWIEYESVRFRVRLVEREAVRASRVSVDLAHLGALLGSGVLGVLFMLLLRAQPPMPIDADAYQPVLARLLASETVEPEPAPGPVIATEAEPELERGVAPRAVPKVTPRPEAPEIHVRSTTRSRPMWAPPTAAQAVGRFGRNHDPIEAARHAGILGPLDNRPFARERVFDPAIEDGEIWASTRAIVPGVTDALVISTHTGGRREGVVGWGSYGPVHGRLASWRETGTDRHATFGSRERRASPIVQVRIGTLDIRGTMDPDLARRIVRAHGNELRGCYGQTVTAPDATFDGTIELSVNGGKVGAVVIDSAFPSELADCMRRRMRAWRFPTGSSVGTDIVTFPLRMSR